ncbi:MAG: hypothetical protein M1819_006125 [Sarea resinae]|nr:MAG: hypothetical protein M1819_006125 [Sarea resinae]
MSRYWTVHILFVALLIANGEGAAEGGPVVGHGATSGTQKAASKAKEDTREPTNHQLTAYLLVILGSVILAIFGYNVILRSVQYIRTLACLSNDTQRFFATPDLAFARIKQHILYAPLFRSRHNREFRLSSAISIGTLPTRFQAILSAAYIGVNVAFCVIDINWGADRQLVLAILRNRTGVLSVVNLVPLFVVGSRNNPLIRFLGVSYDSFNFLHRLCGRLVAIEALAHTIAWAIATVERAGWSTVAAELKSSNLIITGFIGTVAAVVISLQSMSAVRHAFYETFLHLHFALAVLTVVGIWMHLKGLPQQRILLGAIVIWLAGYCLRFSLIVYRNVGQGRTKAIVETLPGDALRVTLHVARPWLFKPGQHVYLYVPSVGLWTAHPFSIAWSEEQEIPNWEKGLAVGRQDVLEMKGTSMSLVIRRRTGFTESLYKKAELATDGSITLDALVEGPYGAQINVHSYGTVMMFAGGVGITQQVPHVRDLVAGFANGTVAARKVTLVWVIQSPEHLEWIRPWMTAILAMDRRREILRILLFVTRPRSTREIRSPSATVQMFPGRPNVDTLVGMEVENRIGAMAVTVCGTGSLSDDVRSAVRRRQTVANLDFMEESFSW